MLRKLFNEDDESHERCYNEASRSINYEMILEGAIRIYEIFVCGESMGNPHVYARVGAWYVYNNHIKNSRELVHENLSEEAIVDLLADIILEKRNGKDLFRKGSLLIWSDVSRIRDSIVQTTQYIQSLSDKYDVSPIYTFREGWKEIADRQIEDWNRRKN